MSLSSSRSNLVKQLRLLLGDQMVDVELDPGHYDLAISVAIDRIRQRSDGALQEDDLFITLQPHVQEYKLPDEVQEVRRLYRRGAGAMTSGGINFDPIDGAIASNFLLSQSRAGGLATWDIYNQFVETAERVFASQYNFVWNNTTKMLKIIAKPRAEEDVLVRVWNTKSEEHLFVDPYTGPWIRSFALAQCKGMLGQARGKFASGLTGPAGTVQFNGDQLLQQSMQEIEQLEKELDNIITGPDGYGFLIG